MFGAMTLSITTLRNNDIQRNDTLHTGLKYDNKHKNTQLKITVIMLSGNMECRVLLITMLSVVMLNVVMLNVVAQNVFL